MVIKQLLVVCSAGITAREHGSNKKLAAQSCALSLIRQLYHLGVVEAYSGVTKKKEGETVRQLGLFQRRDIEGSSVDHKMEPCLCCPVLLCPVGAVWRQRVSRTSAAAGQCGPGARNPHPAASKSHTDLPGAQYFGLIMLTWLILSSLQTPAAPCLWFRGRWRLSSRRSGKSEPVLFPGRHLRSTGTPGPAATSTKGRWHSWACFVTCKKPWELRICLFQLIYYDFISWHVRFHVWSLRTRTISCCFFSCETQTQFVSENSLKLKRLWRRGCSVWRHRVLLTSCDVMNCSQCTPEQISGELRDELMYQLKQDENLHQVSGVVSPLVPHTSASYLIIWRVLVSWNTMRAELRPKKLKFEPNPSLRIWDKPPKDFFMLFSFRKLNYLFWFQSLFFVWLI